MSQENWRGMIDEKLQNELKMFRILGALTGFIIGGLLLVLVMII
jgi:hypothetical protein